MLYPRSGSLIVCDTTRSLFSISRFFGFVSSTKEDSSLDLSLDLSLLDSEPLPPPEHAPATKANVIRTVANFTFFYHHRSLQDCYCLVVPNCKLKDKKNFYLEHISSRCSFQLTASQPLFSLTSLAIDIQSCTQLICTANSGVIPSEDDNQNLKPKVTAFRTS